MDVTGSSACQPCSLGRFQENSASTLCVDCPGGTQAAEVGQSSCSSCASGRYAPEVGYLQCTFCEAGKFADNPEQSEYLPCSVGRYMNSSGATVCMECGNGLRHWTTLRIRRGQEEYTQFEGAITMEFCGCEDGRMTNVAGECVLCSEGLICDGMDVEILPGFASIDQGLSVFRCYGDVRRCPGGPLGTCADGRRGISCADCSADMAPAADGSCQDSDKSGMLPFVYLCVTCTALVTESCLI